MSKYDEFYQLLEILEKDLTVRESPILYPFERNAVYNGILERLAQPLPNGTASPFQDKNPLSAEGILFANIVYLQELMANEINLIPDNVLYTFFRLLGILKEGSAFTIVNLEITRTDPLPVNQFFVPIGATFQSRFTVNSSLITRDTIEFTPTSPVTQTVQARLSQAGAFELRENEFTIIPPNLPYISNVRVTEVISTGKTEETLTDLMYKARLTISRPGDRVITARDYQNKALELGATKVAVYPRQKIVLEKDQSFYDDIITVICYPPNTAVTIQSELLPLIPAGTRLEVIPPKIILLEGIIRLSVSRDFSTAIAFELAANAIVNNVNPPNGNWGEQRLDIKIINEIRRNAFDPNSNQLVIVSVDEVSLTEVDTGGKYSDMDIKPWHLFEIQSSIEFQYTLI